MTGALASLIVLFGLLAASVVTARSRSLRVGVPVLLEFLLAAGLIRLSSTDTWSAIAVAAVVLGIRRLVVLRLGLPPPRRASDPR